MHALRPAIIAVVLGMLFAVSAVQAAEHEAPVVSALPPQGLTEEQRATIFAQDWIADLDAGRFSQAAKLVLAGGKELDSSNPKTLRAMRTEMGAYSERVLLGVVVYAMATDNSECKVRVQYGTTAARMNVTEVVEVLLVKGKEPVVLDYRFEPPQTTDAGLK